MMKRKKDMLVQTAKAENGHNAKDNVTQQQIYVVIQIGHGRGRDKMMCLVGKNNSPASEQHLDNKTDKICTFDNNFASTADPKLIVWSMAFKGLVLEACSF